MQHEMLPVSVDARQTRAAEMLRLFAPSRWHLDRIHVLADQLSQRVTPPRYRMTFRHKINDEAKTVPRSILLNPVGERADGINIDGHTTSFGESSPE